ASIAWSLVFSLVSRLIQQPTIHGQRASSDAVSTATILAYIGLMVWICLGTALIAGQYWAIPVTLAFSPLGLVGAGIVIFSGPLLVTPEWPTYVGLMNGAAIFTIAIWGMVVKDQFGKHIRLDVKHRLK